MWMPNSTRIQVALQPYQTVIAAFMGRAEEDFSYYVIKKPFFFFFDENPKYVLRRNTESETRIHSVTLPITLREIIP